MTPIDGKRSDKGDQWGKKVRLPKQRSGWGCLSVLVPLRPPTIPRRVAPAPLRVAGRPAPTSTPVGRPARGRAS